MLDEYQFFFVGAFIVESCKQLAVADAGKIQVLHGTAVIRLVLKRWFWVNDDNGKVL